MQNLRLNKKLLAEEQPSNHVNKTLSGSPKDNSKSSIHNPTAATKTIKTRKIKLNKKSPLSKGHLVFESIDSD